MCINLITITWLGCVQTCKQGLGARNKVCLSWDKINTLIGQLLWMSKKDKMGLLLVARNWHILSFYFGKVEKLSTYCIIFPKKPTSKLYIWKTDFILQKSIPLNVYFCKKVKIENFVTYCVFTLGAGRDTYNFNWL